MPAAPRPVTTDDLERLLELPPTTVISIVHPTEKVAVQPEENSLRLKNLLGRVNEDLAERGLRRNEIDTLLGPLEELLDDRELWLHQLHGFAAYRTADSLELFRLPYEPPERVVVADTPYVTPLLPALWPASRFYVLALSHNTVRLIHATRFAAHEVDLTEFDLPLSLDEALRWDDLQKGESQHHPTTGPGRGPQGQGGETGAAQGGRTHAFHGHGEDGDEQKDQLRRFFQELDKGLRSQILKTERVPLILAGVDYLHPIYKEVSGYPNILVDGIEGAIDRLRTEELHAEAIPMIESLRATELDELRERYGAAGARGLASSDLGEILAAAHEGRIDTLFLASGEQSRGHYDATSKQLSFADREEGFGSAVDLYDLAARRTIETSGRVYVLDADQLPVAPICALFRYVP